MKKTLFLILLTVFFASAHASKLSAYIKKSENREREQQEREVQQDMNFSDFSFRLDKRYTDQRGERCRDYVFRSRTNPYKHGYYTVCEER